MEFAFLEIYTFNERFSSLLKILEVMEKIGPQTKIFADKKKKFVYRQQRDARKQRRQSCEKT